MFRTTTAGALYAAARWFAHEDTGLQLATAWPFKQFANELVLVIGGGDRYQKETSTANQSLAACFKKHKGATLQTASYLYRDQRLKDMNAIKNYNYHTSCCIVVVVTLLHYGIKIDFQQLQNHFFLAGSFFQFNVLHLFV